MRINLVQGHSAGGLLRRAIRDFGLPGDVRVIDDDLSIGPLHDDKRRNEWWVNVYGPYSEAHQPSVYDQWRATGANLSAGSELVIWSSNCARDHVFERMAAFALGDQLGAASLVHVPASGKLEGVPFHLPDALAQMDGKRRPVTSTEIAKWSASFANDLRQSNGVRLLRQDSITALPDSALDDFLFERCPFEWTKWYRTVGEAMADCDGQNLICDAFFSWRLRLLVKLGRIEVQGDTMSPDGPKDVLVRRVQAN
ncbi:MAG: DUF3658 domain-containing protein [Vitreimonas sp.]